MKQLVEDLVRCRHALRSQVYVNIKTTVATTRLGVLWWILDPLFLMLIYYFVVKVVFGRGGDNYHLFVLCGIVTWQTFSRSITLCASAMTRNASLIKQVPLPMVFYVLVSPVVQVFFYAIGLLIILVWNSGAAGWYTFSIVLVLPLMVIIPFAIGLFLSILETFYRDTGKLLSYVLRFGFYLSPVLYPPSAVYELETVSPWLLWLYDLNPMVHIIEWVRRALLYEQTVPLIGVLIMLASFLVITQLGLWFFRKMARYVPKKL